MTNRFDARDLVSSNQFVIRPENLEVETGGGPAELGQFLNCRMQHDFTVFIDCDFSGQDFTRATFFDVTFIDCNFDGVSFGDIDWTTTSFIGCTFADSCNLSDPD